MPLFGLHAYERSLFVRLHPRHMHVFGLHARVSIACDRVRRRPTRFPRSHGLDNVAIASLFGLQARASRSHARLSSSHAHLSSSHEHLQAARAPFLKKVTEPMRNSASDRAC